VLRKNQRGYNTRGGLDKSLVTIALSYTVFELLDVEKYRTGKNIMPSCQSNLACLPDWERSPPPSQCSRRYAPKARCLVAEQLHPSCGLFSRLSMLSSFQPLSGNSLDSLYAPYR